MAKVHLRKNKIDAGQTPKSVCSMRSISNGKSIWNSRSKYKFMSSQIVDIKAFIAAGNDRCTHCMDAGKDWINRIRRDKGKEEFKDWNEIDNHFNNL